MIAPAMTRAALGGTSWFTLIVALLLGHLHWGVIELLLLLGPLVIVPLGLGLILRIDHGISSGGGLVHWIQLPAALCVAASFCFPQGAIAAAFVAPWGFFATFLGLSQVIRVIREGARTLKSACITMSLCYLLVGCAWLAASRYGLSPMGFQEPIVLLTAVHFHFAGFAAPLLALANSTALKKTVVPDQSLFRVVTAGVLAGPGLLAAGFVIGPQVKLAAALLIALSEFGLASFFLSTVRTIRPRSAQALVVVSAFSVMAAMILAAVWAIGEFPLQPFVHLDQMARFHGTLNAIGFSTCGLLGWLLAAQEKE